MRSKQLDNQRKASVQCVHGDSVEYSTTKVQLQIGEWGGEVQVAACSFRPSSTHLAGQGCLPHKQQPRITQTRTLCGDKNPEEEKKDNDGYRKESLDELDQTAEVI